MKSTLLTTAALLFAANLSAVQLRTVDFENFTPGNGAPTAPDDQGFFWYTFENGSFGTDAFANSVISVGTQQVGAGQALFLGDATGGTFTSGSFYATGTFSSGPDSNLVDFANSDTPSTTLSMSIIWSPQPDGSDDQSFTFYTYDAVDFDSETPEVNNHSALRIKNDGSLVLVDPSNNFSEEPLNVSLVPDQQYLFYIRHDYSTKLWDAFLISGGEKIDLITQRAFTASGITNSESLITIETSFTAEENGEGGNDRLIIDNIIAWAVESRPARANIDLNISYNFDAFVDGANNLFATGAPASFGGFAFGTTSLLHESGYTGIVQGGALDSIGQAGYIGGTEGDFAHVGTLGGATIFGGYVDQPAFHVFDLNTPVVSFSADLRIEPAAERRSVEKVFVSLFDPLASDDISRGAGYAFLEFASDGNIYYRNGPQTPLTNGVPTGQSYLNNNNYRAVITVDYLRQRWSATLEDLESGGTVALVDDEPVDASGWINAYTSANIQLFYSDTENASFPETLVYFDNLEVRPEDTGGELLSNIIVSADYEDYPLGNGPPQDPDGWHPHTAFFFGAELQEDALFYQDSIVRVEDREFTQFGAPVTSRAMVIGGESTTLDFPPDGFAGVGVFPSAQSVDPFDFKNSDTPVLDVQIDFAFFPDESGIYQQWEFFMYDPGPDLENPGFFPHSTVKITRDGAVAVRDEFFDFAGETFISNFSLDFGELYRLIMRIDYERQQWSAWIQDFDGDVTQIADKRSMDASGITSITSGMDVQTGFSIDGDGNVPTGEIIIESWDARVVPQDTTPVAASKLVNFEDFTEGPDNLFRRSPALQPFDGFRSIGSGASVLTSGIASVVANNPINGTQGGRLGGIEDTPDGNFKFFGVFGNYQNSPYVNLLDNGITEKKIEVDFYFDPVQDGSTGVTFYKFGANASSVFANAPVNFNAIVTFGTDGAVFVADDFNSGFVDTGIVLSLETPYRITFDYNYGEQTWSASIRDLLTDMESVLATNRSFPASGWIGVGDLLTIQITNDYRGELYFDNIGVTYSDGLGDAQSFGDITGGETWSDVTAFSSELGMGGISRNASGETEPAIRLDEEEPFTTIAGLSFDSPKVEVADFIVIDGADRPIVNTFDTDGNEIAFFIDASDVPQGISAPAEIGRSPEEVKITGGFDEFGTTPALLTGSAVKNIEGDRGAFTWTSATGSILIDLPARYRSTEPTAFSQSSGYIVGYGTLETGGQEIWILDVDGNTISIIDNIPGSAPQVWPTIIDIFEGKLTVLGYHQETPNRFSKPFIWNADDGFTSFGAPATFDEFVPKAYIGDGILVGQARAHAPLNGGNAYNQNSETDAQWRPFIFRMDDENYAPFRVALETAGKLPEGWTASTIDYSDGSFFGRSINPNGDIEGYAVALHPNTLSAAFNRASVPVLESVPSYAQSEPLASEAIVQSVFSGVSKYMEASWTLDGGPLAGNANTPSANGVNGTYQVRFSDTRDILAQSVTQGEVIHSISELTISDSGLTAAARDALGLAPSETPSRRQLSQIVDLQASGQSISDLTGIGEMPNIAVLDLSDNQISDTDPLSELTKLRELDLSGNPLAALASAFATKSRVTTKNSDSGPLDFLAQTNDLEGLDLSSTGLDSVDELADAPSLRAVTIADNPITDVTVIASLPQIAQIDLSGTSVTDLSPLSTVTTIEEVDLSDTNIDDLSALENAPLLQELDISNTDVTDLSALENAPLLQELDISDTEISDLSALANAPSLKELDLANTQVTDLFALGSVADNIEEIELGGTPITNILALVNADLDFLKMPGVDSASGNLDAIAQKLAEGSRILVDPTDDSFLPNVFDAYSNVIALEISVPLLQSYRFEEIVNLNDRQAGDVPIVQIDSSRVYLFVDPSASAGEARFFRMIGE